MPIMLGLGMAAANTVSSQMKYEQEKKNAAATQRYSPWTGMKADTPTQPSMIGTAVQGGAQGAAMGQSFQNANLQNQWLKQGYSPWGSMNGGGGYNPTMNSQYIAPTAQSYNSPNFGPIGN